PIKGTPGPPRRHGESGERRERGPPGDQGDIGIRGPIGDQGMQGIRVLENP
ncbi:unnamed protein product, partial [Cercopithifilaria johnstoni]